MKKRTEEQQSGNGTRDVAADVAPANDLAAAWATAGADAASAVLPGTSDAALVDDSGVDPELLALPRPRRGRHPLIGVAVILLSAYLMYFVRHDFSYFLQSRTPADLGDVSEAVVGGGLGHNAYVTLRGAPDRRRSLLLKGRISGYDSFFRLLQSRSSIYVQRYRRQRTSDRVLLGVHTGRLMRFDSLPYHKTVRAYLARTSSVAHDLDFEVVVRAKRGGAKQVRDQAGRSVALERGTAVWINASYPDEWIIQLSKKAHATLAEAKAQLGALTLPYVVDDEPSRAFWRFVVLARGQQVRQLTRAFAHPARHSGVVRRQVSYLARWAQISVGADAAGADQLILDGDDDALPARYRLEPSAGAGRPARLVADREMPVRIPRSAVRHVSTSSKFDVPASAMVLMADERPGDYWHYALLYLLLGAFIVVNLLALGTRFRARAAEQG